MHYGGERIKLAIGDERGAMEDEGWGGDTDRIPMRRVRPQRSLRKMASQNPPGRGQQIEKCDGRRSAVRSVPVYMEWCQSRSTH
jgi:hypothetical protein